MGYMALSVKFPGGGRIYNHSKLVSLSFPGGSKMELFKIRIWRNFIAGVFFSYL